MGRFDDDDNDECGDLGVEFNIMGQLVDSVEIHGGQVYMAITQNKVVSNYRLVTPSLIDVQINLQNLSELKNFNFMGFKMGYREPFDTLGHKSEPYGYFMGKTKVKFCWPYVQRQVKIEKTWVKVKPYDKTQEKRNAKISRLRRLMKLAQ